jgi:hypothetical protein
VAQTQYYPVSESPSDTCYAIVDEPTEDPADMGYCCNLPDDIGDDDNAKTGEVTRAYCSNLTGDFTQQDGSRDEVCAQTTPEVTFEGYIKNATSDETVDGANVTVEYGDVDNLVEKNASTDTNGFYNVTFLETDASTTTLRITAESGTCQTTITRPVSSTENNVSICQDSEDEEPPSEEVLCGNNELNAGEDCEVINGESTYADTVEDGTRTCDTQSCTAYVDSNNPSCDSTCRVGCCNQPICQEGGEPKTICQPVICGSNPNMPLQATSTVNDDTVDITVSWDHNITCSAVETQINITGPDGFKETTITETSSHTFTFQKDVFEDGDTADETYDVTARSTFSHTTATNTTTVTPRLICDGRQGQSFCYTNTEGNTGVMDCAASEPDFTNCGGEVCSQETPESASCRQNVCESCRGPYDAFSSELLYTPIPGQDDPASCAPYFDANTCYYEPKSTQETVSGQSETCQDIDSCAEHQSQRTCTNNPCKQELDCEWETLSAGFGDGYCRADNPADVDPSVCQQCEAGSCTESLCQDFYGDIESPGQSYCYYNEQSSYNEDGEPIDPQYQRFRCMARPQSGCATYYQNQTQCTGPQDESLTLADDHTRTPSDDYFDFGTCTYDESQAIEFGCFKDADDNGEPDCLDEDSPNTFNQRCVTDHTPPNTTIQGIEDGERVRQPYLDRLTITTSDNEYSQSNTTVTVEYNDETFSSTDNNAVETQLTEAIRQANTNTHKFTYWAEDQAHNLEVKENHTIKTYDDLDDTLNLTLNTTTFMRGATATANLTATTGTLNDDRTLACTNELTQTNGPTTAERTGQNESEVTTTFGYLSSGIYQVTTTCNDQHGFTYTETETTTIDLDSTITNTTPKYSVVSPGDITITAETNTSRRCQYEQSDEWQDFTETGEETHEATVETTDDGLTRHSVRCANPGTTNPTWIYGDEQYTIAYAVDGQAPRINATITGNDISTQLTTEDQTIVADQATVELRCQDQPNITYGDETLNRGCKTTQYCTGTTTDDCNIEADGNTYESSFIIEASQDQDVTEQITIYQSDGIYSTTQHYPVNLVDDGLGLSVTIQPGES